MLEFVMTALKLSLLGPFIATLNDQPLDTFSTSKVQALLIYLVVERHVNHRRESLMELLWPGMPLESARVNLRQTLYRLRKTIPEVSSSDGDQLIPLLLTDRQNVCLNPDANLKLDVAAFQAQINQDPAKAVTHYRGDFLSDFYLVDSSEFEAWAEGWRENLRRTFLETLFALANDAIAAGNYSQAQTYAWRQLEFEHLMERAYRQLMTALAQGGQRNAALAQYQVCRRRLSRELGLEPSPETTTLYKQIQSDALKAPKEVHAPRQPRPGDMSVFLLTDIEGSTRLWDTYRQAMLPALLQHNAILEEHITGHGGSILELRGDGVKAVFEGFNPLQCMLDIQKALGAADWGEIGDLRIRMGLHGVAPVHKDFDYFIKDEKYYGPVLNHTARIMDAGHGGQILVSESVHHAFALPSGARWQDFGRHEVKSLDQPLQIYGLTHPDLPHRSFPPLRTGSDLEKHVQAQPAVLQEDANGKASEKPIRHNLPAQTTPFIGREDELAEQEKLIIDSEIRLVTIVGPGGMGKTRLALTTAERILATSHFPDGIFFIDLTSLTDSSQIVSAVADGLNFQLKGQEDRTPQQQLHDYLQPRKLLLLLDNCEHLLDGIEMVTTMLQAAPEVQVLATSRERLQLRLEQVFPIDGLEFPGWEIPEDAVAYAAVRLFLKSAQRNQPDFSLRGKSDLTYLARICRLVAGMPLALELAASWVGTLPLSEIAAGIQEGLDFLESELRDLPSRHRSLRAAIDLSWEKLNRQERVIFARLSVFRGGFTREAAQVVAGANYRQLSRLVNKSFLQYEQGQDRYKVHELLRQYGASQLESEPQEESAAFLRRSEYFCAKAEEYHRLHGKGYVQTALDLTKMGSANILAAWDWAIENAKIELIDQAIYGIGDYFEETSRGDLGLERFQAVLDMLLAVDENVSEQILMQHLQAKTLLLLGYFNLWYRHDRAAELLLQASDLIDQLIEMDVDARGEKCKLHIFQGLLNQLDRNFSNARNLYIEALELSKEIDLTLVTWWGLIWLGNLAIHTRALDEARQWYEESLSFAREHDHPRALFVAFERLGSTSRLLLAYDDTQAYYDKAIEIAKRHDDKVELGRALGQRGNFELLLGRFEGAIDYLSQATTVLNEESEIFHDYIYGLAIAHWLSGDFEGAESILDGIQQVVREFDHRARIASILFLAEYQSMAGRYRQANLNIYSLDDLIQGKYIDLYINGRRLMVQGWLALAAEEFAEATMYFSQGIDHNKEEVYSIEWVAWAQAGLAASYLFQNQWEKAYQILRQSLQASIEIQGFIPLLFTLPFTCLYLAQENPDLAREVYGQIQTSPFLAKAQFFQDTVYRHLPDEVKHTGSKEDSYPSESELIHNLWETASKVMSFWESQ